MSCTTAAGLRILVVDDDWDVADMLAMSLRINRHEVRTAYDSEAVEPPRDCMQTWSRLIGMPRLEGYEAARRIQAGTGADCRGLWP